MHKHSLLTIQTACLQISGAIPQWDDRATVSEHVPQSLLAVWYGITSDVYRMMKVNFKNN